MSKVRLNKFLSQAGISSRRGADILIEEGEVFVNQKKAEVGQKIDTDKDRVTVRGEEVAGKQEKVYIKLNKPLGVVSTVSDPHGRSTVMDYIESKERVYPVGRLDIDSKGLILLTNDGSLAFKLTHPSSHTKKVYKVLVKGSVTTKKLDVLRSGILLGTEKTAPAEVEILSESNAGTWLKWRIHEGKNRQVRRMCAAVDLHVEVLLRTHIGTLQLGSLKSGEVAPLSEDEITALKEAVKHT